MGTIFHSKTGAPIIELSELTYDQLGKLKRQIDAEVIRRVMAQVEQKGS